MDIAQGLDIPLRERNALLLAQAMPHLFRRRMECAGMHSVNSALRRILRQHDPFPALVLDRYWNVADDQ